MLTQWRTNKDRVSQYVGKNFGGPAGPMAAQAMRTREEPVGIKPETPVGDSAVPGSPTMIIWQEEYKQYNKRERIWQEEVNPRLFNLLLDHMTAEFRALVEGRPTWPDIKFAQDGIGLIREMHALHHLQDGARPGMWEIVLQDRNMYLCTQKQGQSDTEYLRAFQGSVDAIDEAGRAAGVNHCSIELVCNKQNIKFCDVKIDEIKKAAVIKEAKNRYLAAIAFTGL